LERPVTTTFLEMLDPSWLRPARPAPDLRIELAELACPELSRFLYTAVGGPWYWTERLTWSYDRWLAYLDRPEHETWIGYLQGNSVGFIELEAQAEGNVEIAYFGLLPQFIGRGFGGHLLSHGLARAWEMGAKRVWVHTCTLDGPNALSNYLARGLRIYREETDIENLPEHSPGPWPGWQGISE
jgi:ribosomal protein S18 acetylase RimI-like enzyme